MKNKYREDLEKEMTEKGISKEELLNLTNYETDSLFNKGFREDGRATEPFKRTVIRKLYMAMHIDCEKYLLPKEEETQWLRKYCKTQKERNTYFTHDYWNKIKQYQPKPDSILKIHRIESQDFNKNRDLDETYEVLTKRFTQAKQQIQVHDVLSKGNNKNPGGFKAYLNPQNKVFKAIEDTLESMEQKGNKDFRYTRIFHLSKSEKVFSKIESDRKLIRAFLGETSEISLIHVLKCMDQYPKNCQFYISLESELRSKAIIDDEVLITEDYFVKDKKTVPQFITIYNTQRESKANFFLDKASLNETFQFLVKLDKEQLYDGLSQTIKYLDGQIKKRQEAIKVLREIPQEDYIEELIDREKWDLRIFTSQRRNIINKNENVFENNDVYE